MSNAAPDLERLVADKLALGALPRESPIAVVSGSGTGQPCGVCDLVILPVDEECLCRFAQARALRLHLPCFASGAGNRPAESSRASFQPEGTMRVGGGFSVSPAGASALRIFLREPVE